MPVALRLSFFRRLTRLTAEISSLTLLNNTLDSALTGVARLSSVGILLSTGEYLALRHEFLPFGLFDWRILSSNRRRKVTSRYVPQLLIGSGALPALLLRFAASLALFVLGFQRSAVGLLVLSVIGITTLFVNYRLRLGLDGSDQMLTLLSITLWIASLGRTNTAISSLCLWFIAAQSCLAYLTSGMAKLAGRTWRSGKAVAEILSTSSYGHPFCARYLHPNSAFSKALCYSTVAFEVLFPVVLVIGRPWVFLVLAGGLALHLSIALAMGLNCFPWAFVATYPALLYCAR